MKKSKIVLASVLLAILLACLLSFAMPSGGDGAAPQSVANLIKSAVKNVRGSVQEVLGTCSRRDRVNVEALLNSMRGCDLQKSTELSQDLSLQKKCIQALIRDWEGIQSVRCKYSFQREVQEQIRNNISSDLKWVSQGIGSDPFDQRLTDFVQLLSYWENETRTRLYLVANRSVDENIPGIGILYKQLSGDMNLVLGRLAEMLVDSVKNQVTRIDPKEKEGFFEKQIPYRLVLNKLYEQENPGPISLISLTALSLNSVFERAKFFSALFDLGCSFFSHCKESRLGQSEVFSVYQLISYLGEPELAAEFEGKLKNLRTPVQGIFRVLSDHSDQLERALRAGMTNPNALIGQADLDQFEPLAWPLISMKKEARAWVSSFESQGQYSQLEREYFGPFTDQGLATVNEGLEKLGSRLKEKVDYFKNNKIQLAQSMLRMNEDQIRKENNTALIDSVGYELRMAQLDLEALQTTLRKESNTLSALSQRSLSLMGSPAYRNRFFQETQVPAFQAVIPVSAADAHYETKDLNQSVPDIAVKYEKNRPYYIPSKRGDLISIGVTGQYSPTCALSKEYRIAGLANSVTGPEGFSIQASNRELKAVSSTETTGSRQTESVSTNKTEYLDGCGSHSVTTSIGGSVSISGTPFGVGASGSVSWSRSEGTSTPDDCLNKITANTRTTELTETRSATDSKELSQNASFERGMRSRFAPFPNAPVGALLAVEVSPYTQKVLRTRVVHRNTLFSVSEDADIFLVVNDCMSGNPNHSQISLQISQKRQVSARSHLSFLMEILSDLAVQMEDQLLSYVKQGEVSGKELETLRGKLEQYVSEKMATGQFGVLRRTDFPIVDEWVHQWINTEVAQLERKVRIRQKERQIELLYIKYRDLVNQNLRNHESNILNSLVTDWAYTNLDQRALLNEVSRVVKYLDFRVLPLYKTVHSEVLASSFRQIVSFIENVNLDTSLDAVGKELVEFMSELDFNRRMRLEPEFRSTSLVVSFPKTYGENALFQRGSEDSNSYESRSFWSSVPFVAADRLWLEFMQRKDELHFEVSANDIYRRGGGNAILNCTQRTPFIEDMAIVFVTEQSEKNKFMNETSLTKDFLLPDSVPIVNTSNVEAYRIPSSRLLTDTVRVKFATTPDEVLSSVFKFHGRELGTAQGRSPVGTFTLKGMKQIYQELFQGQLDRVQEILLVFQVRTLKSDHLQSVSKCQ